MEFTIFEGRGIRVHKTGFFKSSCKWKERYCLLTSTASFNIYKDSDGSRKLKALIRLQNVTEFYMGIPENGAACVKYPKMGEKMCSDYLLGLKEATVSEVHWIHFGDEERMREWLSVISKTLKDLGEGIRPQSYNPIYVQEAKCDYTSMNLFSIMLLEYDACGWRPCHHHRHHHHSPVPVPVPVPHPIPPGHHVNPQPFHPGPVVPVNNGKPLPVGPGPVIVVHKNNHHHHKHSPLHPGPVISGHKHHHHSGGHHHHHGGLVGGALPLGPLRNRLILGHRRGCRRGLFRM